MGWAERARQNGPCICGSGLARKDCCRDAVVTFDANGVPIKEVLTARRPLTGRACLGVVADVRGGLASFEVNVKAGSHLDAQLRAMERLGTTYPGEFDRSTLTEQDRRDVRYIHQLSRLAATLRGIRRPHVSGDVASRLEWLRQPFDSLLTLDATAQDHLFELEVGAALANEGKRVRFEEPDIVVESVAPTVPELAVPCKRPRTIERVSDRIRSAIHQARRKELPAIAAVCLDTVLNTRGNPRAPIAWQASSTKQGLDAGYLDFRRIVTEAERRIWTRTDPLLFGIAWVCHVPVIVPEGAMEGPSYSGNTYGYTSLNLTRQAEARLPVKLFGTALFNGLP
jgi:hypothetical protein